MKRLAPLFFILLAACSRNPSAILDPAGPHARAIAGLFWFLIVICGVIWLAVLAVLFVSLARNRRTSLESPMTPAAEDERRRNLFVGAAIAGTVLILTLFVGVSFAVDHRLIAYDRNPSMAIEITGHQWWWEARYAGALPSDGFVTANEVHVPVGESVRLILRSSDVIHSVWIPNLAGKRDVIPGHPESLVIHADTPGVWHGRCAEFCGLQHAYMELTIVAEPKARFQAWMAAQALPAVEPVSAEEVHGRDVFTTGPCGMCHTIRGTDAAGYSSTAPDLTHLMSRGTIGAGVAPNRTGYLGGWIVDPHGLKPGVHMPTIQQNSADDQALLAYLRTLK